MTSNEFWNNDIQEFYCYQIAFINKSFNTSYQQGFYNHIAFSTVIANVFRDKNTPIQNYPKENIYNPFFEKMKQVQVEKQEVAKKEIDWKHIKRFLQQNSERKEENK